MKKAIFLFASAFLLAALDGAALAATCTSIASGNWNTKTTWGTAANGCVGATGGIPGAADNVTIANLTHTVFITDARQVNTLNLATGTLAATLQLQNGGSLTTGGNVTINVPTAAVTKLIQLQATSTMTVNGALDVNGGTAANRNAEVRVEGGSTLNVTGNITLSNNVRSLITFTGAGALNIGGTMSQSGTFTPATSTVTANGAANQTFGGAASGYSYFNIVDSKTGGTWRFAEDVTVNGSITDNGRMSFTTNTPEVTLGGSGVQTIDGTAATTTFTSLTVDQGAGGSVSAGQNLTVNTTLTLTAGIVDMGAFTATMASTATTSLSGGSASSYVIGCLRKNFAAAGTLNYRGAGLDEFPVGIAGSYLPIEFTAGTTSTAGNLIVCAVGTDDPNMTLANGGEIDTTQSLNRYWAMTSTTLTLTTLANAIFKFPNGATEYDGGATPGNFIVERWNGTRWTPTTLVAAGLTSTQAQAINLTAGTNEFAIGEPIAGFNGSPGAFNIFETTTPAGAVLGRIFTKLAGTNFSLSIVAVVNNAVNAAPSTNTLTINVINASGTPGTFSAATNCWSGWPTVGAATTVNTPVGWAAGRVTVPAITAPAAAGVPIAVREARIKVVQTGTGATGCSTDNFSIRPPSLAVTSTNATNLATSGTPTFKTGANFNLTAAAVTLAAATVTGYDGTPSVDNTKVVGTPTAGTIGGSFGAAASGTGIASGAAFTYSEVGNFGLNTDAVSDTSFTSVDPSNDCTADFSNALVGGKYGCSFGSAAVAAGTGLGFGRFIPDHFLLVAGSTLTNRSAAACAPASTFSYMGEGVALAFTLQAQNSASAVTQNYAGASYAKLNPATFAQLGVGAVSGATNLSSRVDPSSISAGSFVSGQAAITATVDVTRAASGTPDGPFTATKIAVAPNDSDSTQLLAAALDTDVDGVGGNDHQQIGSSTEFRFGIMKLGNAVGSQSLDLPMPLQTQYWTGTGFAVNTADNCTSIALANVSFPTYYPSLTTGNMPAGNVTGNPVGTAGKFAAGAGNLVVKKPTASAIGAVDVQIDLTAEAKSYLQIKRTTPPGTYTQNPLGRAAFGLYGSQPANYIYFRENY